MASHFVVHASTGYNHTFTIPGKAAVQVLMTGRGCAWLHRLRTEPAYRRQGCATALMDAVVAFFGPVCRIELLPTNDCADLSWQQLGEFYARWGFRYGPYLDTSIEPHPSDERTMFRDPLVTTLTEATA